MADVDEKGSVVTPHNAVVVVVDDNGAQGTVVGDGRAGHRRRRRRSSVGISRPYTTMKYPHSRRA